jgi:hypothetical protein
MRGQLLTAHYSVDGAGNDGQTMAGDSPTLAGDMVENVYLGTQTGL